MEIQAEKKTINIFIVEDEILIKEYLKRLVIRMNANVIGESTNGEDAIAMIDLKKPDVIFMDIRLSGTLNGFETAKQICRIRVVPIIFMSAYDYEEEIDGYNWPEKVAFVSKPVPEAVLKRILSKWGYDIE